jgi:DnaJ family protein A protein 2
VTPEQVAALEGVVLPPRSPTQLTDMEVDECEETAMHDVENEEEMRRKHAQKEVIHYCSCN